VAGTELGHVITERPGFLVALSYGFGRVKGMLPAGTFGGYPGEGFWSTAYNGAYGAWRLDSNNYRDEGIRGHRRQRSRHGHHNRQHAVGDGRAGSRAGVVAR
jgi:hypothetical protein